MRRHDPSAAVFLMEIMVAVFFFSICAAICMNFFAASRVIADKSGALNLAVVRAANTAEAYKAASGDMASLRNLLTASEEADVELDEDKISVDYPDMKLEVSREGKFAEITVKASGMLKERDVFNQSNGEIYYLEVHV